MDSFFFSCAKFRTMQWQRHRRRGGWLARWTWCRFGNGRSYRTSVRFVVQTVYVAISCGAISQPTVVEILKNIGVWSNVEWYDMHRFSFTRLFIAAIYFLADAVHALPTAVLSIFRSFVTAKKLFSSCSLLPRWGWKNENVDIVHVFTQRSLSLLDSWKISRKSLAPLKRLNVDAKFLVLRNLEVPIARF